MAEKRMISKIISISEKVNDLPDIFDMLLFTWLIPHADDFGRMAGTPVKVKALVVPLLDKSAKDVAETLQRLNDAGLIHWYEIDGDKLIQIINFDTHQSGLHKRTKSKFPEFPGTSRKVQEIPPELNRTEENRTEEKGEPGGDSIQSLLDKYKVKYKGIYELEKAESFVGVVEPEVLEHAIKVSEGKGVPYFEQVIKGLITDGKTTADSLISQGSNKSRGLHQQAARQAPNYVMREFTDEELQNLPRG